MTTDKTPATLAVDVLAVLRRHAESHRASAWSDAYSAQEAPRLEYAITAVAELIEADVAYDAARLAGNLARMDGTAIRRRKALARIKGESA